MQCLSNTGYALFPDCFAQSFALNAFLQERVRGYALGSMCGQFQLLN